MYLYTGTPGSGKSYHMSQLIYWAVRKGDPVICNFEINKDVFKGRDTSMFFYVDDQQLTPENLYKFSRWYFGDKPVKEGKITLYIDECAVYFNARSWGDKSRKDWVKFFTQHRKLGYDIILITQFDTMIDKQVRALVEYEVKHRKLNNVGWVGKLASVVFVGRPVFVCISYWYPQKERLSAQFVLGRNKYFGFYDTYAVFDGQEIGSKKLETCST